MMKDISSVSWCEKTASEVREIARKDGSILIIPVGSIEQHGPHLPVATDTILVETIARKSAEKVTNGLPVLVAPTIWTGQSPHHLYFGGTISLESEDLQKVIQEVSEAGIENGFDAILLLNGHGGNTPVIGNVVKKVGKENPDVEVLGLSYYQLSNQVMEDIRESEAGGTGHGGEFETSLMMYLEPNLVREEWIEGTLHRPQYDLCPKDLFEDGPLQVYKPFEEYTESGAIGTPSLASKDKGEKIFEHLTSKLGDLLREIHENNKRE